MKRCPRCEETKDLSAFYQSNQPYCRECMAAYRKEWRAKNREKVLEADRHYKRRYAYGISEEEYEALIVAQDNRCAICRDIFTETPCVDHGHTTGKVRGLLCRPCNTGLGAFRDSPAIMKRASRYVMFDALEQMQVWLDAELSEYVNPTRAGAFDVLEVGSVEDLSRAS